MNPTDVISEKWAEPSFSPSSGFPITIRDSNPFEQSSTLRLPLHFKRSFITTQAMVNSAIRAQMKTPRRGVSLAAIKKYIRLNYQTTHPDVNSRLKYSIKRYILNALENGKLVRTKGVGVAGSFRLPLKKKLRKPMKHQKKMKQKGRKLKAIRDQLKRRSKESPSVSKQLTKTVSKLSLKKASKSQTGIKK